MPEISLKAYFGKLNTLLSAHAADEVIHHSRHILQSYPKNVTAYRFLGRALVLNGRWDEGREILRRVLTVYPDDYVSHLGLSEANEHLNRPDEAIWHLERAYEHNTNNKEIIEALRGLYRRYRNVENLKIQLTAAAVARQNMRSGNYTQAIDTLRSARARMNDRLDLKLLLAQILWDQGSQEEAAEIAVEVLKVLPDCLEANRIMAKLWLSLGLPSDAQRYVNHLENVDPYLAVEVVQGTPPADDAFRLEELDYVHTSQSEIANARPDWLQEISASPAPAVDNAKEIERDDWSSWTSALIGNQSPTPAEMPLEDEEIPDEQPMSERFAALSQQNEPVIHTEGLTDLFGAVDDAPADELAALFDSPKPSTSSFDDQDPMAWLRDAGIETVDEDEEEPSFESLFAEDDNSPLPEMDANPMAWLEGSNSDLIIERDEPARQLADDEPVFGWMQDDDPSDSLGAPAAQAASFETSEESLDWLQDDHLLDEARSLEGHLSGDPGVSQNSDDFSAFDASILDGQDDMLDQNEALTADRAEPEPAVPGARRGLTAILSEGNFDWMKEAQPEEVTRSDDMDDWLNQFGPAQPRPTSTDTPDWLTDLEQTETAAPSEDEWLNPDEAGRPSIMGQANVDSFARMSGDSNNDADNFEDDDDDDSDWLAEFAPEEEIGEEPEAEDEADWLNVTALGEAAPLAEAPLDTGALPDWLTELAPEEMQDEAPVPAAAQPESEFNWTPAAPAEETALSDWLSELSPEGEAEAEVIAATGATADAEFSWTAEASLDEESGDAEPVAAEETDWLSELESTSESADAVATASDPDYPWMQGEDAAESEAQSEAEAENVVDTGALPEWLSELETASAASQVAVEAEYTWMGENVVEDAEADALPVASEAMDWLSELQPEGDAVAEAPPAPVSATGEEEYTWMNEDAIAEAEAVAESASGEDADWLSELAPGAEQPAAETEADAEPVASDEMSWLSELQPETEPAAEVEAVTSEDADWLSELAPEAEVEAVAEPVASDDMSWLSELQPESEAAAEAESAPEMEAVAEAVASDDMSWLSELQPDSEAVAEAEPAAETEAEAMVAEAVASDDIGWLTELEPETEAESVSTTGEEDYTWMGQEEASEQAEATEAVAETEPVASEELSWLSELEPETEAEPVAVGDDELAWMAADDESDKGVSENADEQVPDPAAAVASGLPNWLSELEPENESSETEPADEVAEDEEAAEPMPVMEADAIADEFGDDGEFDQNDDQFAAAEHEEVLEPTPAHNAPDWLNAMVPGLDVDYEADDAEWVDDEEAAFDSSEREYAWVEQMVEEEMAAVEYSGYSFTSPPTWLASLGAPPQGGGADDDLPDWISDDADADVPSWLR